MTPKELSSEKYSFSGVCDTALDDVAYGDYPAYINLETYLQAISHYESPITEPDNAERRPQPSESRHRGLDRVLTKLSGMEIPCKEHVEEYLRDQHRRHLRPTTLRNSLITIESFLIFLKKRDRNHLEEMTRGDLEAFIEHEQDRGLKASTVNTRLRTLKASLRFLVERDIVRSEVLSKRLTIKVPNPLPRAVDPDDVKRLLGVIDDTRDRAMVVVLLRTGMRIGELLSTLVREVNLNERKIEVYETEKTRVGRVVYVSDDALIALRAWLRKRDRGKAHLFYAQGRQRMTYPAARVMFNKYLDKAGLSHKGYTLHCLRHSFATDLLNAGMRLEYLQPLLGHSSIEMTRRYAKLTDKSREQEYFRAMAIIERGEADVYHQLDRELQTTPKEEELLTAHSEELHEHP